jgi:hypothetical protein
MNKPSRKVHDRVLALHPTTTGFGWALFEAPLAPVDWGTVRVPKDRNAGCLSRIEEIIARLHPTEIVLESFEGNGVRRSARIRRLYRSIISLAAVNGIGARIFSREAIAKTFSSLGTPSRFEIAAAIASHIAAFEHLLPPRRKIWLPENPRMALFNAAALAMTYFAALEDTNFEF